MLAEELEHLLVSPNVLFLDARILQVATGGHPSMDLILEDFDVMWDLETLLEPLDIILRLILGC